LVRTLTIQPVPEPPATPPSPNLPPAGLGPSPSEATQWPRPPRLSERRSHWRLPTSRHTPTHSDRRVTSPRRARSQPRRNKPDPPSPATGVACTPTPSAAAQATLTYAPYRPISSAKFRE
jgi:hypothetical protein